MESRQIPSLLFQNSGRGLIGVYRWMLKFRERVALRMKMRSQGDFIIGIRHTLSQDLYCLDLFYYAIGTYNREIFYQIAYFLNQYFILYIHLLREQCHLTTNTSSIFQDSKDQPLIKTHHLQQIASKLQIHHPQQMKAQEIELIIQRAAVESEEKPQIVEDTANKNHHLFRAIFIAVGLTESMQIKDLKPSRLGITIKAIKQYLKVAQDSTPICRFLLAKVENQLCKPQTQFVYNRGSIEEILDHIRVSPNAGFFSLENTLTTAMDYFQKIPSYFHKQVLIIQSSASTKDHRDIFETIALFQKSKIAINIASLVGSTHVFQKLSDACKGQYKTVSNEKELETFLMQKAKPPLYDSGKVSKKLVKMSLAKRQYSTQKINCFCHMKHTNSFFICGVCKAVVCGQMPFQCPICMCVLVFPSDLYRYTQQ